VHLAARLSVKMHDIIYLIHIKYAYIYIYIYICIYACACECVGLSNAIVACQHTMPAGCITYTCGASQRTNTRDALICIDRQCPACVADTLHCGVYIVHTSVYIVYSVYSVYSVYRVYIV
jgi:hypothetical protein